MTGWALTCGHRATPSVATRLRLGALDATNLEADRMALALRAALERITIPLARATQTFVRKKAWFPFGHARVADHARERFGRSGRKSSVPSSTPVCKHLPMSR